MKSARIPQHNTLQARMPQKKPSRATKATASPSRNSPSAFEQAMHDLRHSPTDYPNISARWLLKAFALTLGAIILLAWFTLWLLYAQGSWQLLYHPKSVITLTPASAGLTYESVHFAATETGVTQLTGWWIPADNARYTVLYLHGADGNLSDTVPSLAALHKQNLAIFAIDYRGYGQSQAIHDGGRPNEKQLRQDAEWALTHLTVSSSIPAKTILVYGTGLGANLAAELAADHSELAGIILDQPLQNPLAPVFNDARSRLVPAHLLIQDRYNLTASAAALRIPSLWLLTHSSQPASAYQSVPAKKTVVWLTVPILADPHFVGSIQRWLDDL
jgi:pimeloyl-ACP methyl ester carboxylesterase